MKHYFSFQVNYVGIPVMDLLAAFGKLDMTGRVLFEGWGYTRHVWWKRWASLCVLFYKWRAYHLGFASVRHPEQWMIPVGNQLVDVYGRSSVVSRLLSLHGSFRGSTLGGVAALMVCFLCARSFFHRVL